MHHTATHPPVIELGLRWIARFTGLVIVVLFAIFLLGESVIFNLLSRTEMLMFFALGVSLVGILLGWHSELLGGTLNIAGIAAFYLLNYASTGRIPGGPIFPLVPLPGVLYLLVWWRHR